MGKKVLLINDIAGYGKVALSAMIPVLTGLGHDVYNLPTAIVSNTLDYGLFRIQDTTPYMKDTIAVWKKLGFSFDAISTGLLANEEQVDLLMEFCSGECAAGVKIFVDPIMADNGSLYNGMTEKTVAGFRRLLKVADYAVPNYTEAAFLTERSFQHYITREELRNLIDDLRSLGAKSVAVTSLRIDNTDMVGGYDAATGTYFTIPYTKIPVFFPGTGDIFLSVLMGSILNGKSFPKATGIAMRLVREMVLRNQNNTDKFKGIMIEKCLDILMTDREKGYPATSF
ncbi:MAG: bifunctional hydroxymethylpyrimidine kinase/phosphomethylpyrimidine kinase [Succinimonas sp.]|nr:bifunctional hydroxymethylpyrimidine kinase/phosphomethylpyrimidine kinase [Succinimonas sp.]